MRLLVITQSVDKRDMNLGFFHRWLEEMASNFDSLEVIALRVGEYDLPKNVTVYSLGKESGVSRLSKIFNFYKLLFELKDKYDKVFVHMNPEYLVLAGWLWKLQKKPAYLWYLHKSVTWKLKYAQKKVEKIFTANKESCRLKNRDNIIIVGHGIDTDSFIPRIYPRVYPRILSVGRMSRSKRYEVVLDALSKVQVDFNYKIIAPAIDKDGEAYKKEIMERIYKLGLKDRVELLDGVFFENISKEYNESSLFVHTSETGSVDKVVLEAMACEIPVLTSSEAFSFLPDEFKFKKGDTEWLAKKIEIFMYEKKRYPELRKIVEEKFSLKKLIKKIKEIIS